MCSSRLPEWLRRPPGSSSSAAPVKQVLRSLAVNTVCEESRCPNIAECFGRRTATFMLLGDICTRGCRFCAVKKGRPAFVDELSYRAEAERVAQAAKELDLAHVVITSVTRDDLTDGGAGAFAAAIAAVRELNPRITVEVLVPDFLGREQAIAAVLEAAPDVFNHNLETVARLYQQIRPGAGYHRSLSVLHKAKQLRPAVLTKTGIMLGLGETKEEIVQLMQDCRDNQVEMFTAGQYLRPTRDNLEVRAYLSLDQFQQYRELARAAGFKHFQIGPLVRSSYHAAMIRGEAERVGNELSL